MVGGFASDGSDFVARVGIGDAGVCATRRRMNKNERL